MPRSLFGKALTAKANQLNVERGKLIARTARPCRAKFAREIRLLKVMKRRGAKQDARDKRKRDTAAGRISIYHTAALATSPQLAGSYVAR